MTNLNKLAVRNEGLCEVVWIDVPIQHVKDSTVLNGNVILHFNYLLSELASSRLLESLGDGSTFALFVHRQAMSTTTNTMSIMNSKIPMTMKAIASAEIARPKSPSGDMDALGLLVATRESGRDKVVDKTVRVGTGMLIVGMGVGSS